MKIAILGAGLTGLELGKSINKLIKNYIIFEKESEIGGMCRTNKTGDYHWDFAVHALYSHYKEAMSYFFSLPIDYEYLERKVKIFHFSNHKKLRIIEYPFETGIKELPINERWDCILGYIIAHFSKKKNLVNLEEWIDCHLGKGIAKYFMVPYNNKIWNCRLNEISTKLISSKIEPAPLIEFILSALGKPIVGRAYQAKFIYPKGGIKKLIDFISRDLKENISLNTNIERLIRKENKWIIVSNGRMIETTDIVVSTIPLVELLKKIDVLGIKKEYKELKWNNTFFIMIGLKPGHHFKLVHNYHWVFFKDKEFFYRITLMHNFSPDFLPAAVIEVTQKDGLLDNDLDQIRDRVINDFIQQGMIASFDEIETTDIKLLKYTYPIPIVGLDEIKEEIRRELEKYNIFLLGRNGRWDYINMDQVILDVKDFVREKLNRLCSN